MTARSTRRGTDHITLIVVPDETARVRRFQFPRAWLGRSLWAAGVLVALLTAAAIDYVHLRLENVDVERLRSEAAAHREQLTSLTENVQGLEQELARIEEFERKVRVIANLPTRIADARVPPAAALVGPDRSDAQPAEGRGDASASADASVEEEPSASLPLDAAQLARIQGKAHQLTLEAATRTGSVGELIEELRGQSQRFESTPSIWPTDGWVTSGYGYRRSPFTGRRSFHAGLDIAADFGTEVVAPARGKVVFVGRKGPMGKSISIDHGYGLYTSYGHLAQIHVKRGQEVERGERIAAVGSTGRSTGPHLHYAVAVRGKAVNPSDYILD